MKITNEGIKAELDILVEQILTCKDLEKLKEVTRMNYPDMAREFNSQVKLDSSEEKQGQWIKHNGNEMPNNVRDSTFVDIKFIHGRELLHVSPLNYSWENWILYEEKGHEHIIAYRIIPEQKEEKAECSHLLPLIKGIATDNNTCSICWEKVEPKTHTISIKDMPQQSHCRADESGLKPGVLYTEKKEPKKQTLSQYWFEKDYKTSNLELVGLMEVISEYLEQSYK